jgi:HK97 family phage prohead protease
MSKRDHMEQRAYNFEIRATDTDNGAGIITGRPIVYESKTDLGYFDEIIKRGALKNANLKDVRFLVNHDLSRIPLARSRNNNENSTMRLSPDDEGMAIRVTLDVENNTEARALYSAVQRGDITGMSFLFSVGEEDWADLDTDHPTRSIISIAEVLEVSAVTFPAYDATEIETRSKGALENARARALDNARHKAPDGAIELERARNIIIANYGGMHNE